MIGLGAVGSPVDVATLMILLVMWARERARLEDAAAGVVALARRRDRVDDDQLQSDLGVDDVDVRAIVQERDRDP